MAALQEDNKKLELSLSKMEAERKQAQERSNTLEKVYRVPVVVVFAHKQYAYASTMCSFLFCSVWFIMSAIRPIGKERSGD